MGPTLDVNGEVRTVTETDFKYSDQAVLQLVENSSRNIQATPAESALILSASSPGNYRMKPTYYTLSNWSVFFPDGHIPTHMVVGSRIIRANINTLFEAGNRHCGFIVIAE